MPDTPSLRVLRHFRQAFTAARQRGMFRGAPKATRVHLEQTPIRPHWHLHIPPAGLALAGMPAGGIGTVSGNVAIDQVGLGQL